MTRRSMESEHLRRELAANEAAAKYDRELHGRYFDGHFDGQLHGERRGSAPTRSEYLFGVCVVLGAAFLAWIMT